MSNRSRRNTTRGGSTAPPPPPSHADLLIFLYAYIYIYVYVFCMRGAWLTYFKIMPASNKGKKKGTNFRLLPFVPFLSAESVNPGRARQDFCSMHMKPGYYRLQYYTPSPPSCPPFLPPHVCLYNCRAFVIKLERIIVCHISKLRQGQRLPIACFTEGEAGAGGGEQLRNPWPIYEQVEFLSSVRVCVCELVVALIFNLIALAFLMRLH